MSVPKLQATDLSVHLGERSLWSHLSLTLHPGEILAVLGPNGTGKTTLLRTLAGLRHIESGTITLNGTSIDTFSKLERAKKISFLSDVPDATFEYAVSDIIAMGRYAYAESAATSTRHVQGALKTLALEALASRPYPQLSSGQQQLVALARIIAQGAPLWLLDEPTSRLDLRHVQQVEATLKAHVTSGGACVVVLHDLDLALRLASRALVLGQDGAHYLGPPAELLTPELIQRVWGVQAQRVDRVTQRPSLVLQP